MLVRKTENKVNRSMNLSVGKHANFDAKIDRKPKTRLIIRDASAESIRSIKK